MQLPGEDRHSQISQKTIWLLLAIALNALELFLPRIPFLPWLKPGIANVVTIIWLIRFGFSDALLYTILRSWISGFYFGFSFITLSLSLSGGILATAAMAMAWNFLGKRNLIGTMGLGILGAIFHNIGQITVVYFLLTHNSSVFYQLPFMGLASLIFGCIVGVAVPPLWKIFNSINHPLQIISRKVNKANRRYSIASLVLLAGCLTMFAINNLTILLICTMAITVFVMINRRSFRYLYYPVRYWPLFLFIMLTYFIFPYGTRIHNIPILTVESCIAFVTQFLRIWIWLEAGVLLQQLRFHETFFSLLKIAFKKNAQTLEAGIIALEYFPQIINFVKSKQSLKGLHFFRQPLDSLIEYLRRMQVFIGE